MEFTLPETTEASVVHPIVPTVTVTSTQLQPVQTLSHTVILTPEQTERAILDFLELHRPDFPKNAKVRCVEKHTSNPVTGFYTAVKVEFHEIVKVGRIAE